GTAYLACKPLVYGSCNQDSLISSGVSRANEQCEREGVTYNSLGKSPLGLRPAEAGFEPGATTILFVEDEKLVREVACEILQSAGHRALQAQCAAEARRMFEQEEDVNLLVTDVMLPDANGTDLAEELGSRRPSLKTIFISGYPENAVTRGGIHEHESRYLPKPFSSESLIRKIKQVLASDARL